MKWRGEEREKKTTTGMIQREGRKKKEKKKKQPVASHGTAPGKVGVGRGVGDGRGHGRLSFPLALREHTHTFLSDGGFLKRSEDGQTLSFVRSP